MQLKWKGAIYIVCNKTSQVYIYILFDIQISLYYGQIMILFYKIYVREEIEKTM
jgi:hypothetical protein